MNRVFSFVFFMFTSLWVICQGDTAYIYTFGGPNDDLANDIIETRDGGYLIVGATSSFGNGSSDVYVVKLDSNFQQSWSNVYGGPQVDWGQSVIENPNSGEFSIVGYTNSFGTGGYDGFLYQIDEDGELLFEEYFGGSDWDFLYDINMDASFNLYLSGERVNPDSNGTQAWIVKTNVFGIEQWQKEFGEEYDDFIYSSIFRGGNLLSVGGISKGPDDSESDLLVLQTNGLGEFVDSIHYNGGLADYARDLIELSNGDILIGGMSEDVDRGDDDLILTLNPDLSTKRFSRFGHETQDELFGVEENSRGEYVFIGDDRKFGSGGLGCKIISTNENLSWKNGGPTFGGILDDHGNEVIATSNEEVVVAGWTKSYGSNFSDIYLIRFPLDSLFADYTLSITEFEDTLQASEPSSSLQTTTSIPPRPFVIKGDKIVNMTNSQLLIGVFDPLGRRQTSLELGPQEEKLHSCKAGIYWIDFDVEGQSIRRKVFLSE